MRGGHKTAHPSELSVSGHAVKIAGMRGCLHSGFCRECYGRRLCNDITDVVDITDIVDINREFLKRPLH